MKRAGALKRTPFQRSTPMARGSSTLARSVIKKKAPKKRAGHDKAVRDMCRGMPCYLKMPGVICAGIDTVVPAHSNAAEHGKGMGLKAKDKFTLPACLHCHSELDSGMRFTKAEKKELWNRAYERWSTARAVLFGVPDEPLPDNL